jgi:hypothetical protein
MNPKKLKRLRRDIEKLRRKGDIKERELRSLAERVGRKRGIRGKEPTYVSERFPDRPLSIPAQRVVNRYTALDILNELEQDLDEIEATLEDQGGEPNGSR